MTAMIDMSRAKSDPVQQYWEERARASSGAVTATTDDVYMRELEGITLAERLRTLSLAPGSVVLDLGCGDGHTTLALAEKSVSLNFVGIDYSAEMIRNAERNASARGAGDRVRFCVGDAREVAGAFTAGTFDAVISVRSLINLPSCDDQYDVLRQIAEVLKPGGTYLGIENFLDGQENLNAARATMGLPEIPVRWHNLFFDREEFLKRSGEWFDTRELDDFASSYYFATRVVYSAYAKSIGQSPSYDHEIHRLAVHLPSTGAYSPIRLAVCRKGSVPR